MANRGRSTEDLDDWMDELADNEPHDFSVELTRFSGHPTVRFGGVQDGKQDDNPVHAGV
jgi:hypothetical protein